MGLVSLVKGDDTVDMNLVRVVGLMILRGVLGWFKRNYENDMNLYILKSNIENTISELERWNPQKISKSL